MVIADGTDRRSIRRGNVLTSAVDRADIAAEVKRFIRLSTGQ